LVLRVKFTGVGNMIFPWTKKDSDTAKKEIQYIKPDDLKAVDKDTIIKKRHTKWGE